MGIYENFWTAVLLLFYLFAGPSSSQFKFRSPKIHLSPNEYSDLFRNVSYQSFFTVDLRSSGPYKTGDGFTNDPTTLTHLSYIYLVFSLVHLCYLGYWIKKVCLKIRPCLRTIHFLMGGLLLSKALNLICVAVEKYYVNLTGNPNPPDFLFYMFQLISVVRLSIIIVLILTGWSSLNTFFPKEEKMLLMVLISLQIFANLGSIVISETGPFFIVWDQFSTMADMICSLAAMIPGLRSLTSTTRESDRKREKLAHIWVFYMLITLYLLFLRAMGVVRKSGYMEHANAIDAYNYMVRSSAAMEINNVVFYSLIFNMFRRYFRLYYADRDASSVFMVQINREPPWMIRI